MKCKLTIMRAIVEKRIGGFITFKGIIVTSEDHLKQIQGTIAHETRHLQPPMHAYHFSYTHIVSYQVVHHSLKRARHLPLTHHITHEGRTPSPPHKMAMITPLKGLLHNISHENCRQETCYVNEKSTIICLNCRV